MVTLEGSIKRFVGLSSDVKPQSTPDALIPAGSSFLESDTGAIARFTGTEWRIASPEDAHHELLLALYLELRQIRQAVQITTGLVVNDGEPIPV